MKLHKYYEEVDGDITKVNWQNEAEIEANLDTMIKLHSKLSYYKLILKKYGASYIFKIANVNSNVTSNDVVDLVKCKENDYFAFIGYISKETGVDVLKITSWLNELTLEEGFNQSKESKAVIKLKEQLEMISQSKSASLAF